MAVDKSLIRPKKKKKKINSAAKQINNKCHMFIHFLKAAYHLCRIIDGSFLQQTGKIT